MQRASQDPSSSARAAARTSWQPASPQSTAKTAPAPEIWRPAISSETRQVASRTLSHASALLGAKSVDESASIQRSTSVRPDDRPQGDPDASSLRGRDNSTTKQAPVQSRTSGLAREIQPSAKLLPSPSIRRATSHRLAEPPQLWKPSAISKASSSSAHRPSDAQQTPLARSVSSSASLRTRSSMTGSHTLSIARDEAANARDQAPSVQAGTPDSRTSAHTTENSPAPQSMATTLAKQLNDQDTSAGPAARGVQRASDQQPAARDDKARPPPVTASARDAVAAQSSPTKSIGREPTSRAHLSRSRSRSSRRESRGRLDASPSNGGASTRDGKEPVLSDAEDEKDDSKDSGSVKREMRRSPHVSFAIAAAKRQEDDTARAKAEAEENAEQARRQEEEVQHKEEEARHKEERRRRKKEIKQKEELQRHAVRMREAEILRKEEELRRREELWLRREAEVVQAQLSREEEKSRKKTDELRRLEEGMRMWQRAIQKTEDDLLKREEEYRRFHAGRPKEQPLKVHDILEEVWRLRQEEFLRPWTAGV